VGRELRPPVPARRDAAVGDDYDQPVRFGVLGNAFDFVGRMPAAVVVDLRGEPTVAYSHRGSSTFDRPGVDDLLAELDALAGDRDGGAA